jgi:hypothetical protein
MWRMLCTLCFICNASEKWKGFVYDFSISFTTFSGKQRKLIFLSYKYNIHSLGKIRPSYFDTSHQSSQINPLKDQSPYGEQLEVHASSHDVKIFLVIFWNFFWRCRNVLALWDYDFLIRNFKKLCYPKLFFLLIQAAPYISKELSLFDFLIFLCGDPYVQGKYPMLISDLNNMRSFVFGHS